MAVKYVRNPAVAATEIDAETFLVEPDTGEVFYLDEVTSALWRYLTVPRDEAEIIDTFAAAFPDAGRETIMADMRSALGDMTGRALIVLKPADPETDP